MRLMSRRVIDTVWPRSQAEHVINPPELFAGYERSSRELGGATGAAASSILTTARALFDDEQGRPASLDGRAGLIIGATGVIATLFAGVGGSLLGKADLGSAAARGELVFYVVALVYLGRAVTSALRVQGSIARYRLGPDDLVPIEPGEGYDARIAQHFVMYTIANYRVNNRQVERLTVAQHSLRNGVLAVLAAALMVPFVEPLATNPVSCYSGSVVSGRSSIPPCVPGGGTSPAPSSAMPSASSGPSTTRSAAPSPTTASHPSPSPG